MSKQETDKVVSIKNHAKKEGKKIPVVRILLGIFAVLALTIFIIISACKIKDIEVKGVDTYTQAEIQKAIKDNGYVNNTLFYTLKCKLRKPELLPFVNSFDIKIKDANHLVVTVHEKKRAGCIEDKGKYVYFDKQGYMLESHVKKFENIPMVTGLTYKKLEIGEKIPIKKQAVFKYLLQLTTAIDKHNITVSRLRIEKDGNILLLYRKLTVNLGDKKDLDLKMPELIGIFEKLKEKNGTIDFTYFDEYQKRILFKPKKS